MKGNPSILPLRVEGLGFAVRGEPLLDDVTLTIRPQRRLVILGPNGAGKSLLLRLCHGLLQPSAGRVAWSMPRHVDRAQAMVFQRPVLLRRSVFGNMTHALGLQGYKGEARRKRARLALERFGLSTLADRPARLLSGGEQQRMAMARAWALNPEILFLDEPSSQLDPATTRMIEDMIGQFSADGMTIVMTTHDLGQAQRLAEDIAFLHRGRLVEASDADQFFHHPASREARAFLAGELLW